MKLEISAFIGVWMPIAIVVGEPSVLQVMSNSFPHGSKIPQRFTCDGANISPHITWSGLPPSGRHRYIFMIRALDKSLPAGIGSRADVERQIGSHVVAEEQMLGFYGPRVLKH